VTARQHGQPGRTRYAARLGARSTTLLVTLLLAPASLRAQQGPPNAAPHLLNFYLATQESEEPPTPVEPSRVPLLRKRIAVEFNGVPVYIALQKLSHLSGLHFIYAGDVVDGDRVVHLRARDITVAAALTEVLLDASVEVVLRPDGNAILVPAGAKFSRHDTTSSVRGTVTDSAGTPVSDAEVYVVTSGRDGRTDEAGSYTVAQLLQGPTRLRARMPGWQPVDTAITLASHSTTTVNFVFRYRAPALDTVRVVSTQDCPRRSLDGFECRRRAGIGVFRDAKEIAALDPIYFADIFDGIAGVKRVQLPLDVSIEATTQWRCIVYLENGHPPFWKNVQQMNFLDVIAFEFYDSPEKVPEWYKAYSWSESKPCSVIVLWLRGVPDVVK
jgi:hypothetical protein